MNDNELQIARILFQNKVLKTMGNEFENIFSNVMQKAYTDFKKVKPQGQFGDRKNDGWIKSKGIYFQVYAPEDINIKISKSIEKLNEDFPSLYKYWNNIAEIKEFYYVINERYYGIYPEIEQALGRLSKKYTQINFASFSLSNLEDLFLSLEPKNILDIIGFIPKPDEIEEISINIIDEVVKYLLPKLKPYEKERKFVEPDFIKKIEFNNLGVETSALLTTAYYQIGILEEYFRVNSEYAQSRLKEKFFDFYNNAKKEYGLFDEADNIFFYILKKASPRNNKQVHDAVLVLMSKYFETCDIFEELDNK